MDHLYKEINENLDKLCTIEETIKTLKNKMIDIISLNDETYVQLSNIFEFQNDVETKRKLVEETDKIRNLENVLTKMCKMVNKLSAKGDLKVMRAQFSYAKGRYNIVLTTDQGVFDVDKYVFKPTCGQTITQQDLVYLMEDTEDDN